MARNLPHIRWLTYYLTEACNLKCGYCYLTKNPGQSTLAVGEAAVDFLIDSSGPSSAIHLRFFGGEPLLEFAQMERIVRYAQIRSSEASKQVTFDAVTNGTLLNRPITERLRSLGVELMLSLDGGPATMAANRGLGLLPGGFAEFEGQIATAIQAGVATAARMTVLPSHDIRSDILHLVESGHKRILVCLASNLHWKQEQVDAVYAAIASLYVAHARQGRILPLEFTNRLLWLRHSLQLGTHSPLADGLCSAGKEMLSVAVDGRLFLCHRFVQLGDEFCVGDVFGGLDLERLASFGLLTTDSFRHEGCRSCFAAAYCPGSCMAANYTASGDLFFPVDSHCLEFRAHATATERIYDTLMSERCAAFTGYLNRRSQETRQSALSQLMAEAAEG